MNLFSWFYNVFHVSTLLIPELRNLPVYVIFRTFVIEPDGMQKGKGVKPLLLQIVIHLFIGVLHNTSPIEIRLLFCPHSFANIFTQSQL